MTRPDTLEQDRRETLAALDRLLERREIGPEEHDRRVEVARHALDETELATVRPSRVSQDPPRQPSGLRESTPLREPAARSQPAPRESMRQLPAPEERGYVVAMLGSSVRKGPWEPPEKLYAFACMGGVQLDFREAALLEGTTEVEVFALMGGINITVPDDIDVEVNGFGFMGGFDHVSKHVPEPGRPLLRIRGLAVMGGVSVKVKPLAGRSAGARIAKKFRKLV